MLPQKKKLRKEFPLLFSDYGSSNLSDKGIAIIRDMVNESEKWEKLYKIDINSLGSPYNEIIQQMKIFVKLKNAPYDAKLFSLKYRIFCDLPNAIYEKTSKLIDSIGNILTNDLSFEKECEDVVLKFKKTALIDGNSALRAVLRSYLISKFKTNSDQLDCQFSLLSKEFKSIRGDSQLTKVKVDDVCNNLNSLYDKLALLERSYKEIIQTRYSRRHALIDNWFSFMKNPLTMSQRKHIGLLKAKMDVLTNEHLVQIIDKQEKEQFEWVIENYFKLAHHKDWRVNFKSITDEQSNALGMRASSFTRF
jgi:predicted transposase YbfD/YdcC